MDRMEAELKTRLVSVLPYCLDMDSFRSQGYRIEEGPLDVDISIASELTHITLSYPLSVEKQDFSFSKDLFTVTLPSQLGRVFELAVRIVNTEAEGQNFDKDSWMKLHGADIEIEKHKPYPDTVYALTDFNNVTGQILRFYFAIQGKDTVSEVDLPDQRMNFQGYCQTEDGLCFANAPARECIPIGTYSNGKPAACASNSEYSQGCKNCSDCGSRKHGETWCEYDSIPGNGLDFVGSRHHVRSCLDGRIYYEECRDFREEICIEDNPQAGCRQNRWQDCVLQQSQAACEDDLQRDCIWNGDLKKSYTSLFDKRRCSPHVPPGLKHWQFTGIKVCQMANEYNDCDGATCPQDWVDSAAAYCYQVADCGNYPNIAGQMSNGGFFSTQNAPSQSIFPPTDLYNRGWQYALKGNLSVPSRRFLGDLYNNPQANINEMM